MFCSWRLLLRTLRTLLVAIFHGKRNGPALAKKEDKLMLKMMLCALIGSLRNKVLSACAWRRSFVEQSTVRLSALSVLFCSFVRLRSRAACTEPQGVTYGDQEKCPHECLEIARASPWLGCQDTCRGRGTVRLHSKPPL
jgi:hypothetical protein